MKHRCSYRTILVGTLGKTPQVLVETVWALATQQKIVPDEIVAISMANYADIVSDSLFGNGMGWSTLLGQLRCARIKAKTLDHFSEVIIAADDHGPIQDLRTTNDNSRCANYLFGLIRKYTLDDSTRIILSLSGGRKSLAALATVVMSLLARPQDELIHLIVDSKIENDGQYHFPRGGRGYSLFEIPFVRTRGLLKGIAIDRVQMFEECLRLTQGRLPNASQFVHLTIDMTSGALQLGTGKSISDIDPVRFILLWLVFREKKLDRDRFRDMLDKAITITKEMPPKSNEPVWFCNLRAKGGHPEFRQIIDWTKKKVLCGRLGLSEEFCRALLPNSKGAGSVFAIKYPTDLLVVKESDFSNWLYDKIRPQP